MFSLTPKKTLGYSVKQVDAFLASARTAFDAPEPAMPDSASLAAGAETVLLTAESIRHTAFAMQKGGYAPGEVDAALERLEDAFAAREREREARRIGEQAWLDDAEARSQEILSRLKRGARRRFARTSVLSVGYRRTDVDRLANKLVKYFEGGRAVSVEEVRTAVFRPERGGYREAQVDVVLDAVVEVMLAVR